MYVCPAIFRDPPGTDPHKHHNGKGESEAAPQVDGFETATRKIFKGEQSFQQNRVPNDQRRFVRAGMANHETPWERDASEYNRFKARGIPERKNKTWEDVNCIFRCLHGEAKGKRGP